MVVVTQILNLNDVSLIPKPMVSITLLGRREQSIHCFTILRIPCVTSEATSHDHAVIGKSISLQRTIHTSGCFTSKKRFLFIHFTFKVTFGKDINNLVLGEEQLQNGFKNSEFQSLWNFKRKFQK